MPRRAKPGDRAAIEEALGPELRSTLRELERVLELPAGSWQATPLEGPFTVAAVVEEAGRLVERRGLKVGPAIDEAASRLGVPPSTVRTRAERWFREARKDEYSL